MLSESKIRWMWSEAHNDTSDRMAYQVLAEMVEVEVRKRDDELMRQMLGALEYAYRPLCMCFAGCDNCDPTKEIPDAQAAINAARARLGAKT
jgi:hypothetical protein